MVDSGGHFAKYWGGGGGRYCFKIRIQALKIRIQALKIRIQALKIRIQAFKIRIQAFKIRFENTLYAYILVCFLVPLAPKQHKL